MVNRYEPTDFSLVQGGPLVELYTRFRLWRPPADLLPRRVAVLVTIAWLPLLVLTAALGHAYGGVGIPFLCDLGAQVRLLVCVPLLIGAEVIVHERMKATVQQFLDRGLISPGDLPRFEGCIASAIRLRNSAIAEGLLLVLAIVSGYWLGKHYLSMAMTTWYANPIGKLTMPGYWYVFVSMTIFRFLMMRWYFRMFVWYRFLWQISRQIRLELNALHPDRAGGLAFLALTVTAFLPIMLAHTIGLAGVLAGRIWYEGASLPQFELEIAAWLVVLLVLTLAPLFFFVPQMAHAKRVGLRDYGVLASRYVADFHHKWFDGASQNNEPLIGSSDIQSLADLSSSFNVVNDMRLTPCNRGIVLQVAMVTALPLAPLVLTMLPLSELIQRALKLMF